MTTLNENGFVWQRQFADKECLAHLLSATAAASVDSARAGVRDLLQRSPEIAGFAACEAVAHLVNPLLGGKAFAVRAILFDKTPEANWRVAWHQDMTIAVSEKRDVPGFGPWSMKDGVPHTHAPVSLLERMLTLRLHLDDCEESNGVLRVIPGSHRQGKLDGNATDACKARGPTAGCR